MSTKHNLSRQIRNGKVVYVQATPHSAAKATLVRSSPTRFFAIGKIGAGLLLAAMAMGVLGVSWLSYQVVIDPDVAFWLNQYVPASKSSKRSAVHQPRTLEQILQRLKEDGQFPGKPIVLATDAAKSPLLATQDLLIPIYDKDCSEISCQRMQALHVYRSLKLPALLRLFQGKRYYRSLDRFALKGVKESTLATLANNPRLVTGANRLLPLSRIETYRPAPKPGAWLRLTGLRTEGSATAIYGQIMYYHPDESRLVLMLNWASPAGEFPRWQQVTGDQRPELVVTQTVGLEPQFAVYQMHPAPTGDLQIERISLVKPAFDHQAYTQSLLLARSGLWSPAQKKLVAVKQNQPQQWSTQAQAQLDFINLHAKVAQSQAKQTSASTVQTIVARLVNGEWQSALKVFQAPSTDPVEVRELLLADPGRLSSRVDAFLAVNPKDMNAIAWGTMIRHVQDEPKAALVWAQQRTGKNKAAVQRIQALLKRLDRPRYTPKERPPKVPKPQPSPKANPRPSKQRPFPKQPSSPVAPDPAVNKEQPASRRQPESREENGPKKAPASSPSPTVAPSPEPTSQPPEPSPEL